MWLNQRLFGPIRGSRNDALMTKFFDKTQACAVSIRSSSAMKPSQTDRHILPWMPPWKGGLCTYFWSYGSEAGRVVTSLHDCSSAKQFQTSRVDVSLHDFASTKLFQAKRL